MSALRFPTKALADRAVEEILSPAAVAFVAALHEEFGARRDELLTARASRPAPRGLRPETQEIRDSSWRVAAPRLDYVDRRTEITGPTDRKLVINALNSGARGFMADFEDATSPTWRHLVDGQLNLTDALVSDIDYTASDGRHYALEDATATLLVRPRGLHLPERHMAAGDGRHVAGALVDFGLHAFHNARRRASEGQATYLYLPKLEHHLEARWWNDVLTFSEEALDLPPATFRPTVLIETVPAAFQMHEILWELRERSYGLNAGRWDYIFSMIKCYPGDPAFVMPDRGDVSMTVPFMSAYADLVVATCHARGAFAMGGMAALIPSRSDPEVNARALRAVAADKAREAAAGFDGTWVAHPDVVAVAQAEFDRVLGGRPNQIDRVVERSSVEVGRLLDVASTPGEITEAGLRTNVRAAFLYISNWLCGRGAVGIAGLMEDAATAEISRAQIWQWIRHGKVTRDRVIEILDEESASIRAEVGEEIWAAGRPDETRAVFARVALADELPDFLTLEAYELLPD